jgi:predicted amidohydrolase
MANAFRKGGQGGVIGPEGRVSDYIQRAAKRGILFDVGHGSGGFSFVSTEAALEEGFLPTTISSDSQREVRKATQRIEPGLVLRGGRLP